jgi:hypothetical protein
VLRRIGHVLVLRDLSGFVEDPEVAFIRESVLFPARHVRDIERDEHKDLVAIREECVRLEALEREGRQALEECRDIRRAAPRLQPGNARRGSLNVPLDVRVQFVDDGRDISAAKRLIDLLDGVDVAHD